MPGVAGGAAGCAGSEAEEEEGSSTAGWEGGTCAVTGCACLCGAEMEAAGSLLGAGA